MELKEQHNPGLYRELAVPFPSVDAAGSAMEAFLTELGELRKKHKITNVCVSTGFSWMGTDGEECEGMGQAEFGDAMRWLPMVARHMGILQERHTALIGRLVRGKKE